MFHLPGGTEWIIILVIVLLIFGPKNLPRLGSAVGRFARNLRAGQSGEPLDDDTDPGETPSTPRGDSPPKH